MVSHVDLFVWYTAVVLIDCVDGWIAQLICPISYEDPDNKWELIAPIIQAELPIREVSHVNPLVVWLTVPLG